MTREGLAAKARRYLLAGALTVIRLDGDIVDAVIEGDTGTYELGHDPGRGWHCSCPARGRCSHTAALKFVTVRGLGRGGAGAELARQAPADPPASPVGDRPASTPFRALCRRCGRPGHEAQDCDA